MLSSLRQRHQDQEGDLLQEGRGGEDFRPRGTGERGTTYNQSTLRKVHLSNVTLGLFRPA